ncbi:sensor histidine kinase [Neobacillus cucumis]|uniref:sensor histidine kinase n=1 Tax=Neobacillus cucumis TaxID=1740721 RepID=UPI0019634CF5|nr:ATP-binding protein [Neobacillus cucumis]MBM7652327.1 two-component system OmpR family sensor kinase [Neobacillus cucumis]
MIKRKRNPIKNFFLPRSLRYQLLTRTLFILAFILLAIGFFQYFVMKDFLYRNEAETLSARLMSLHDNIHFDMDSETKVSDSDDKVDNKPRTDNQFFFLQDMSLAEIDSDGNYSDLFGKTSIEAPKLSKKDYQNLIKDPSNLRDQDYKIATNAKGIEQLIVFKPTKDKPGETSTQEPRILQLGTNTAPLKDVLYQQLLTFMILSALALVAGLWIYLRVLKKTLVPLSTIVHAVKNTDAGNLEERLPVQQGQEEIDRLSIAFNAMLERIEKSFEHERETKEQMRRFIADASHELRTPLTSISGFVEVLLRGAANRPEQLFKALNSMQGETRRIIKLVEDLLFLTKLDRAPDLQAAETNLSELIRDMEPQLNVLAGTRTVQFDLSEGLIGCYESDKIKQVILNLFNNAVQHTDSTTGTIKLSMTKSGTQAILTVQDNGAGISSEKLPYIFDRFYRADPSRTRLYGGAGLGLAITNSIVEAHGGRIEVESQIGNGTTFRVFLPLL